MRKLVIEPTPKTPKVVLDPVSYTFVVEGRSIPEDSVGFYKRLYAWMDDTGSQLTGTVNFEFKLEYFNTSSSKCMLDLYKLIQKAWEKNPEIGILWYANEDDTDMVETGEDYAGLLDVPFEIIVVKS